MDELVTPDWLVSAGLPVGDRAATSPKASRSQAGALWGAVEAQQERSSEDHRGTDPGR